MFLIFAHILQPFKGHSSTCSPSCKVRANLFCLASQIFWLLGPVCGNSRTGLLTAAFKRLPKATLEKYFQAEYSSGLVMENLCCWTAWTSVFGVFSQRQGRAAAPRGSRLPSWLRQRATGTGSHAGRSPVLPSAWLASHLYQSAPRPTPRFCSCACKQITILIPVYKQSRF